MQRISVDRSEKNLVLGNSLFKYEWSRESAGFPSRIGFADGTELFDGRCPVISIDIDGRAARPSLEHGFSPDVVEYDNCVHVIFDDIRWEYENGGEVPDYRLSLYYEIFADGVAFARTFFFTDTLSPGTISKFVLQPGLTLPEGCSANWAWWEFPDASNGKLIQAINGFGRNLAQGRDEHFEGKVLPFVSFDFGRGGRRDMHCEFFVECFSPLVPEDAGNTSTRVTWEDGSARVAWNFQESAVPVPGRAYQWRNTWGWSITRFPVERKHPPFRLYHYMDNFRRYPGEETIREAAAEGANLFMLHENWRLDMKHGEFPYDKERLLKTIETIHKYGMRAALYVRGNEDNIRQDFAEPLRRYLKKDWDGLYMDFGTPAFFLSVDEYAMGGRMQLREYHKMMQKLREFVGEDGFILSHSGSFFASMAHTGVDGYVAGEQEKGQLIQDRTLHAYFSGLSISPSTLWTAAFPTYRSKAAVPYLASTAQVPFVILGTGLPSCSLDHPNQPSVVAFQRPLWRLWEILDGEKDVKVYTMQSTEGVFDTDEETGACLIATESGDALLIATNFSPEKRDTRLSVDWTALGMREQPVCAALSADYESCSWQEASGTGLCASVEGFGVTGWLFAGDANLWKSKLEKFARPYPSFPGSEEAYRASVENIRRARFDAPAWKECYLKVRIPNFANSYEESLWIDLYENQLQLQDTTDPGNPKILGYIGRNGFTAEPVADEDRIVAGVKSEWIPLHNLLDTGEHTLTIATKRGAGGEFYSFIEATLSSVPAPDENSREILYSNSIDTDWSLLDFKVSLED